MNEQHECPTEDCNGTPVVATMSAIASDPPTRRHNYFVCETCTTFFVEVGSGGGRLLPINPDVSVGRGG